MMCSGHVDMPPPEPTAHAACRSHVARVSWQLREKMVEDDWGGGVVF